MTLTVDLIKAAIARGPYTWPGAYPKFAVTRDGETLCIDCCEDDLEEIVAAVESPGSDPSQEVVAIGVNWEDESLFCPCGDRIECAYPA